MGTICVVVGVGAVGVGCAAAVAGGEAVGATGVESVALMCDAGAGAMGCRCAAPGVEGVGAMLIATGVEVECDAGVRAMGVDCADARSGDDGVEAMGVDLADSMPVEGVGSWGVDDADSIRFGEVGVGGACVVVKCIAGAAAVVAGRPMGSRLDAGVPVVVVVWVVEGGEEMAAAGCVEVEGRPLW